MYSLLLSHNGQLIHIMLWFHDGNSRACSMTSITSQSASISQPGWRFQSTKECKMLAWFFYAAKPSLSYARCPHALQKVLYMPLIWSRYIHRQWSDLAATTAANSMIRTVSSYSVNRIEWIWLCNTVFPSADHSKSELMMHCPVVEANVPSPHSMGRIRLALHFWLPSHWSERSFWFFFLAYIHYLKMAPVTLHLRSEYKPFELVQTCGQDTYTVGFHRSPSSQILVYRTITDR